MSDNDELNSVGSLLAALCAALCQNPQSNNNQFNMNETNNNASQVPITSQSMFSQFVCTDVVNINTQC